MVIIAIPVKLFVILLNRRLYLVSKADLSDYLPYFQQFQEALISGSLVDFFGIHVSIYTLLYPGWLFVLPVSTDDSIFLIRVANVIISVLILYPLNELNEVIFGRSLDNWQALLLITWPSYIPFSITVGRTQLSVLLVLVSLVLINRFLEDKSLLTLALAAVAIILTTLLRIHYLVFPVSYLLVAVLAGTWTRFDFRKFLHLNTIFATLLGALSLGAYAYLIELYTGQYRSPIRFIIVNARHNATGGSAYLTSLYPTGYADLLWYLPIQGFYFLFSPMPWQAIQPDATPQLLVTAIETWALLGFVVAIFWRHIECVRRNKRLVVLLAVVVLVSLGLGAGVKNAGGAHRWRMPAQLLLILSSTTLFTRSIGKT